MKSEAMGARVLNHAFEGHIQQKNWAANQAKGQWIISLDADESLSEELKASLLEWKKSAHEPLAYRFNRLTSYCGHWVRHGGWYPDQKLRLWKNGLAEWTGENPHDRLELVAGENTGRSIGHLKGDLSHARELFGNAFKPSRSIVVDSRKGRTRELQVIDFTI